mmetsp:Transcript_174255/g.423912  ORF Transcript_174255/g.423912 Transcript_174255/m.423912 type:complete len:210 (-) Transcript_174255:7-636(-)
MVIWSGGRVFQPTEGPRGAHLPHISAHGHDEPEPGGGLAVLRAGGHAQVAGRRLRHPAPQLLQLRRLPLQPAGAEAHPGLGDPLPQSRLGCLSRLRQGHGLRRLRLERRLERRAELRPLALCGFGPVTGIRDDRALPCIHVALQLRARITTNATPWVVRRRAGQLPGRGLAAGPLAVMPKLPLDCAGRCSCYRMLVIGWLGSSKAVLNH